ncbi:MAG: hypothetical protein H7Y20_09775 [Bryobacteraceae bacterium]|nr:hypothetical protein [Bryobacteraceae bacterium]
MKEALLVQFGQFVVELGGRRSCLRMLQDQLMQRALGKTLAVLSLDEVMTSVASRPVANALTSDVRSTAGE